MSRAMDRQILRLWCELAPASAYTIGLNEYSGRLFIPSEQNIRGALHNVRALRNEAANELQAKVLDGMEAVLEFDEPQPVLDDILNAIFNYLLKEKSKENHLTELISSASPVLDAFSDRFSSRRIPVAVKALTLYRLKGLLGILDAVRGASNNRRLWKACDMLEAKTRKQLRVFKLEGFGKGTFEEVELVFKKFGSDMGRQNFYPIALKKAFDYSETPEILEKKGLAWLEEELPKYRRVLNTLANIYGCDASTQTVANKIAQRGRIDPKNLVKTSKSIRRVLQNFVDHDVVRINRSYDTEIIETPSYLTQILPTAYVVFLDTFQKPYQRFLITADRRRDPVKSIGQLIMLIVHEEYGHCVHHSNSAHHFGGNPSKLELIYSSHQAPITEGISFNREMEFLEAAKKLEGKKNLTRDEKAYVKLARKYGGLHLLNLEIEYEVRRSRLVRFLRVIGDVRVNTGSQGLLEFIDWAHRRTGLERSNIYYQLFPAHEGMFPGYATTYAVVGNEIRSIEDSISNDRQRVLFSTYLTGIGYPPRSLYRRRLEEYAAKLRVS
ncbi:MAG: hypothetical protein ACHQ03_09585 [Candidatus Bathyarchaeia archaeon]